MTYTAHSYVPPTAVIKVVPDINCRVVARIGQAVGEDRRGGLRDLQCVLVGPCLRHDRVSTRPRIGRLEPFYTR